MERSLVSQRVLKTAGSKANYQRKVLLTTPYYFRSPSPFVPFGTSDSFTDKFQRFGALALGYC